MLRSIVLPGSYDNTMLSYRHAFHAGNHGDVLKHAVFCLILEHLNQKEKPYCYIDSHAGAGRYDLSTDWAQKHREFADGIGRIWQRQDLPAALLGYIEVIKTMNPTAHLNHYPGSPWLAWHWLRTEDKARLFELHSNDEPILRALFAGTRRFSVEKRDGFAALKALLPPPERRGLVLIDPSYEIKQDFAQVVVVLKDAYRRFATGIYLLWYPLIDRRYIDRLEKDLSVSGMHNVLLAELQIARDNEEGLTGSGLIIVNPPWGLADQLNELLPYLAEHLGRNGPGHYRLQALTPAGP